MAIYGVQIYRRRRFLGGWPNRTRPDAPRGSHDGPCGRRQNGTPFREKEPPARKPSWAVRGVVTRVDGGLGPAHQPLPTNRASDA